MSSTQGDFTTTIRVDPPTALNFKSRSLWAFTLTSLTNDTIEARSTQPDAEKLLQDSQMLFELEKLSWDLLWDQLVVVEFEPSQYGTRTTTDELGRQLLDIGIGDRIQFNPPNPRAGLRDSATIDLLQRIRDRIITVHLAGGDIAKSAKLMANAAVLLGVEHFIKGMVNNAYALVEFYLVVETIENQIGGRNTIQTIHGKGEIAKITRYANADHHDQRHAPRTPSAVVPLPPNVVNDAAAVAKAIVIEYVKKVI